MIQISVVVCTYNRADLLTNALESLFPQTLDKDLYEIIVIDNNSTDNTKLEVERLSKISSIRYIFEERQGLSHARNRGWREAKGEYIAYTDDDCIILPEWLSIARDVIERVSPGIFGGPYLPWYNTPKPPWFKDSYGSHIQGNDARLLRAGEYLDGGNMFVRRILLEKLGGFNIALGMSGNKLGYGEETAFQKLVRSKMPHESIYYEPRLVLYHLVHPSKMNLWHCVVRSFTDGRYYYRLSLQDKPSINRILRIIVGTIWELSLVFYDSTLGIFLRNPARYPFYQNFLYERVLRHIYTLGSHFEQYLIALGLSNLARQPRKPR